MGTTWGQLDRIAGASTSTNIPSPALYGVRKDHKSVLPGQESFGPPIRSVVGATEAPNSRFGHFLSMLVNNYADCEGHSHEFDSPEDMRAAFEEYNSCTVENRDQFRIVGMDVKALYPSMKWAAIMKAVREMIEMSEMEIDNVDWQEVGKYLAVMLSEEEIETEGLSLVVPKRKTNKR